MQQSFDSNVGIGSRDLRRVYLITYSQADVNKFPTRQSFANAVLAAFAETNVVHWCCSKEHHQKSGVHYHVSEVKQMSALVACKEILSRPIRDICALL